MNELCRWHNHEWVRDTTVNVKTEHSTYAVVKPLKVRLKPPLPSDYCKKCGYTRAIVETIQQNKSKKKEECINE